MLVGYNAALDTADTASVHMTQTLYTIGHSNRQLAELIDLLTEAGIEALISAGSRLKRAGTR